MLRILSEKKRMAFYKSQLGKTRKVVWESENKNGMIQGYTDNYVKVQTKFDSSLINQMMEVDLVMINSDGVVDVQLMQTV